MQPQRTATGYRTEPARLVECLHYLYYWLPKEKWWHLYGDGRKYGKKDTVMMAISNVNNEQKLTLEMVMVDQVYANLHVKHL